MRLVPVCCSFIRYTFRSQFRNVHLGKGSGTKMFSTKVQSEESCTVNTKEVAKFAERSSEWWIPGNHFSALHAMNSLRVPLVRDGILSTRASAIKMTPHPLQGYTILDVGCGGGFLSEPLARIGASVTGLDPSQESIEAAVEHASLDETLKENLTYMCGTVEDLLAQSRQFDAVVCSEVVEHVNNVDMFIQFCVDLVKPGGSLFFTTINRTPASYFAAIIAGEYVLRILPRGTHSWEKFVKPEELETMLDSKGCNIRSVQGMAYNPITGQWSWCPLTLVNYAVHAVK